MTTTNKVARTRVGVGALVVVAALVSGAAYQPATAGRLLPSPVSDVAASVPAPASTTVWGTANTPAMTPAYAFQPPELPVQPPAAWGALLSASAALLLGLNVAFLTHLRRAYASPRRGARRKPGTE
ncbi:MAG: hypothetical protein KGP27_04800 [Hyphomicrobiales bacterium]|nr:hypothetical protein [Hyphomicrobiales bacterium]